MKKIILSFVGTMVISTVMGVGAMWKNPVVEQPKEQLKQEVKIEKVEEKADTEKKAVEVQEIAEIKAEEVEKTEKVEKKETENKSTEKSNSSSVSNVPKQENTTKQETKKVPSSANTSNTTPSTPQNNQQNSQPSNQPVQNPQPPKTEPKNNASTTFYDSITGGKKERKANGTPMTESEVFARGEEIQEKELDYVLDWNEAHPDNQIKPDINYFRVYPVIDSEGTGYYLHFFCVSGEGNDAKLKSMF